MEERWFVYFENGWLHLHRSWTGSLIYCLRLDDCPAGVRVIDSWVNRDSRQYRETDLAYDRLMLDSLLQRVILQHDAAFPVRSADHSDGAPGFYPHHTVGRGYPENTLSDSGPTEKNGG